MDKRSARERVRQAIRRQKMRALAAQEVTAPYAIPSVADEEIDRFMCVQGSISAHRVNAVVDAYRENLPVHIRVSTTRQLDAIDATKIEAIIGIVFLLAIMTGALMCALG